MNRSAMSQHLYMPLVGANDLVVSFSPMYSGYASHSKLGLWTAGGAMISRTAMSNAREGCERPHSADNAGEQCI